MVSNFLSLSASGKHISCKGGNRLGEHKRSSYCGSHGFRSTRRSVCSHRSCRSFPSFRPLGGNGPVRMGSPSPSESLIVYHGPLMIIGFLGTLIGLERAVALDRLWPYGIPMLSGVSALSALVGLPVRLSAPAAVAASLLLIAVFFALYRQYPSEHFVVMGLSAFAWLVGNIIWFESLPFVPRGSVVGGFSRSHDRGRTVGTLPTSATVSDDSGDFPHKRCDHFDRPCPFDVGTSFRRAYCGPGTACHCAMAAALRSGVA